MPRLLPRRRARRARRSAAIAPAAHADRVVTLKGYDAPGTPAKYDKVKVYEVGSAKAKRVLVLEPGTLGGARATSAGDHPRHRQAPARLAGVVGRAPAEPDRGPLGARQGASRTRPRARPSSTTTWAGWPTRSVKTHFPPPTDASLAFAKRWGMNVAMQDLRRVVAKARQGGKRKVVVGGHSLGGSMTPPTRPGTSTASRAPRGCRASCSSTAPPRARPSTEEAGAGPARRRSTRSKTSPFLDLTGHRRLVGDRRLRRRSARPPR